MPDVTPQPKDSRPVCDDTCCGPLRRREFLGLVGSGLAAFSPLATMAGPFEGSEFEKLIPADKKLTPEWVRSLFERGKAAVYRGAELRTIGMPVGGICAGQVYLGGDGRLWHWDIFNRTPPGEGHGPHYAAPMAATSPFEQGFAIRVRTGEDEQVRPLDASGFADVRFRGAYPIGRVEYADANCPVAVTLEAFSPFIPLRAEESSLPVVLMQFTVRNTGAQAVEVELAGFLENAVCLESAELASGIRRNRAVREHGTILIACTAEPVAAPPADRPPQVFASFDEGHYGAWKVVGEAFGTAPAAGATAPEQRLAGQHGKGLVNSYAKSDAPTGRLISPEFTIERPFIRFLIGGGRHPGQTCMNLVVDGKVARTQTGRNSDGMLWEDWNVRTLIGRRAHFEIVDEHSGGWGHIDIDQIEFADVPRAEIGRLEEQADFGSMVLALLEAGDGDRAFAEVPARPRPAAVFSPEVKAASEATRPFPERPCGAVIRSMTLAPGQERTTTFAVAWHFPNLRLEGLPGQVGRRYATRFVSAAHVVKCVAENLKTLCEQTRLWSRTWYDSTLPYWFLDRTFANVAILASSTAHWLANGRFYGWEGVGCCPGTCTHVWHYAQAVGRLFPELERSAREMADFGVSFDPATGIINFRGEVNSGPAIDGQAGCVLRSYREHQMSPDDAFLRRNWSRIRKALEYLIGQDMDEDGILEGAQHNTLDAFWYGPVAWLSSLYLVALRAGEEMAREVGDNACAERARRIFEHGRQRIVEILWNGEYFYHRPDPNHPEAVRSGDGCEIDQVFGQSWAFQVGLGRVLDEQKVRAALRSLWRYNFTPDVGAYRKVHTAGRWYAMPGEAGLIMCTFPRGGAEKAGGTSKSWFAGYFNECMSGFEYQVAGHMIWEGMVTEGLAVTRAIHDRYHPARRNPWNEIECGDHYARAMASYGVYLAACGYEYHGPKGHLGFSPRLRPEDFRAAFTAAEGWGTLSQERAGGRQISRVELAWGRLRLRTLAVAWPPDAPEDAGVALKHGDAAVGMTSRREGAMLRIEMATEQVLQSGESLVLQIG